jgi:hypothetical protein
MGLLGANDNWIGRTLIGAAAVVVGMKALLKAKAETRIKGEGKDFDATFEGFEAKKLIAAGDASTPDKSEIQLVEIAITEAKSSQCCGLVEDLHPECSVQMPRRIFGRSCCLM